MKAVWGVFKCEEAVHICPCNKSGCALAPHLLDATCECRPALRMEMNFRPMVLHNDYH